MPTNFLRCCGQVGIGFGEDFEVTCYSDGVNIVEEYEPRYDIIFMDIQMEHMDGMTAAHEIRKFDQKVILIFITNMSQYAINGYSVNALNYLLKPVSYFVFSQQLQKTVSILKKRHSKYMLLPQKDGSIKLNISKIIFIESFKHKLTIYTPDGEYNCIKSMKELEGKLSAYHFFRCNNCYLVNLAYVRSIQGFDVVVGKHLLNVSRSRKKEFIKAMNAYALSEGTI